MSFGAECRGDGTVHFRLWAPAAATVTVHLDGIQSIDLVKTESDWFELQTKLASAGTLYKFQIDGKTEVPDPASRFQPSDVHGPSEVIDPLAFQWSDESWNGRLWEEVVLYELHVGTFTPEGTFAAIEEKLDYLADIGITAIELMPVADFAGARNWGYDGVLPYAPDSSYGRPEDLKRLIQAAHARNLMVFLDVVYNHFGPDGNYLRVYAPQFFTERHHTPWGEAINFDGEGSRVVRDFFIHNAMYWLEEYHFDGLRFDAVHAIKDNSRPDILMELAARVRDYFGSDRHIHLVLENDDNAVRYLQRDPHHRPKWYTAQWNDDIHHAAHAVLTQESDGYYADYAAAPVRHLGRCLAEGFSYQGERSPYREGARRGEPSANLPPTALVSFLQNHDQVGNRAFGDRIVELASAQSLRAMMAVLLLAPTPPLLFMGEEFGATTPFLFFCNFAGDLAAAVTKGRRGEFAGFKRFSDPAAREVIPDPNDERTFLKSKLDWSSLRQPQHQEWQRFYAELLHNRQRQIVPHLTGAAGGRAKFEIHDNVVLQVEWRLKKSVSLHLLANLASRPSMMDARPRGQLIYSNSADHAAQPQQKEIPPWFVAWFLNA